MSVIKYPLNVLYIANVFDFSLVEYGFTYIIYCSNTLIYTNSIHIIVMEI